MAAIAVAPQPPAPSRPKFTTGGGDWPRVKGEQRSSVSDERDDDHWISPRRSFTRSRPAEVRCSPEGLVSASAATSSEPSPSLPHWSAKRHLTCGNPTPGPPWSSKPVAWRGSAPGKLKTANAALVVCLNIDVDPPDVVKTNPCAELEAWVDPHSMIAKRALEAIGTNLQHQFEGLSLKIAYKPILDPAFEDLRRFCMTLRKQAKDDAVLFYYNGHGVPKPTASGELWCFNKHYTQYIPVSLQELQGWLGSPGVYIWDCSAAGNLLQNFNLYAERRDHEVNSEGGYPEGAQPMMHSLQLAACGANEQLPSCPEFPADVFTACLTSPIDIALRYFITNNQLPSDLNADMVLQMPGDLKDRRTPLGELNWIFTAITDTIAWTTFSRETFTRLYRCDLLIASLFRNFLLAERILKDYDCTPHTYPPLPSTNTHPLWATWDLAVDACLRQLPDLLSLAPSSPVSLTTTLLGSVGMGAGMTPTSSYVGIIPGRIGQPNPLLNVNTVKKTDVPEKPYVYVPSRFFSDQLTAFEVWISRGGSALTKKGPLSLPLPNNIDNQKNSSLDQTQSQTEAHLTNGGANELDQYNERHLVPRKPPDQLPIVLQVLLSQPHRLRALILLSQFVDLGPWAVHLVLTIGIFPYISKLLQAAGQDLRPVLIFIWARILAVDPSVQTDLYNTQGYKYFSNILGHKSEDALPNAYEHKAMCSFILASIARDFPAGQVACYNEKVFDNCYDRLEESDFLLRQWSALCIGQLWDGNDEIKVWGVDRGTQDKLIALLSDDSTEVRAAALYALGTFMGASGSADPNKKGGGGTGVMHQLEERVHFRMEVAVVTGATLAIKDDASPMCRKELLIVISALVKEWRGFFVICAWLYWEEDRRWRASGGSLAQGVGGISGFHSHTSTTSSNSSVYEDDIANRAVVDWLQFEDDEMLREENRVLLSSFFTMFVLLLDLSVDPYQEVAANAQTIVDYIMALLLVSPFKRIEFTSLHIPPTIPIDRQSSQLGSSTRTRAPSSASMQSSQTMPPPPASERDRSIYSGKTEMTLPAAKRSSLASTLIASLTSSITFPAAMEDGRMSPSLSNTFLQSQQRPNERDRDRPECPDLSRPPSPNLNIAQYIPPYVTNEKDFSHVSTSHTITPYGTGDRMPMVMDFQPCDVMAALTSEDMERLKARRRAGRRHRHHHQHQHPDPPYGYGHYPHHHNQDSIPSPTSSTFSTDRARPGLATGAGIRDVLPLKSTFYDWCAEYFKEPQMRQTEADEAGSVQYNYQVWRQSRNDQVSQESDAQAPLAESNRWDRQVATVSVNGHPLTMKFHSFDPHIVIANENDMITVWDWHSRKRLNYFCNGNPKTTSITALEIINQDVGGLIMAGSSDGVVRLYRNYDPTVEQGPLQMVSAFRALTEIIQARQGSGMVMDWKQSAGELLVGGDSRIIRVWDAQTETQGLDLETNSESPVTAIDSDVGSSKTFIASFADGVVKVFDRRLDDEDCIVRSFSDHSSWVQNVKWHPTLSAQFISGSVDGLVKLFDLRGNSSAAKTTWNSQQYGLSAFDVHAVSGVFVANQAITSYSWRTQRVVVQSLTKPSPLSTISINTGLTSPPVRGLPSPYIPRYSSLIFHPTQMLFASGSPDGNVKIMGVSLK